MDKKVMVMGLLLFALICLVAPVVAAEDAPGEVEVSAPKEDIAVPVEPAAPAIEEGEGVITGEVISLNTTAGAITIKAEDGIEKSFSVVDGETILWKGIEDIKLSDIKKGEKAEIGYYTDDAGKLIASWVDVIIPEETIVPVPSQTETTPPVETTTPAEE